MKGAIIGKEVFSDKKSEVFNPSTGEILDYVPVLTRDQIKEAIDLSDEVYQKYSEYKAVERKKLLIKASELIRASKETLAVTMSSEMGRPIKSSRAEIERTVNIFEGAAWEIQNVMKGEFVPLEIYETPAGNENRIGFTVRESMGVVAAITPFNFPGASFAHKVATALAVGNTVVHKPTKNAPLTQLEIAKLLLKAGFPEGSINVVTGKSNEIGEEFTNNKKIKLITFTGSADVGLELASRATKNGIRIIMELGGSDAQIVLDDADINLAAEKAIYGRYDYAGQFCNATKRLIVSRKILEKFEKALIEKLRPMKIGNALEENTDIGPLISRDAVSTMQSFFEDAIKKGSKIVYQTKVPEKGFYFPPTIFEVSNKEVNAVNDEVFGPIMPIQAFEDDSEAISFTNSSRYGLDASIFSSNFSRAYKIARKLKVGTVVINDTTRLRWDYLPFGGPKESGIGRESIYDTMLEMTETKVISYKLS
ncbi:MAG: aldehyde dehydrogenase family protein [Thermoplasmata archaeon]